MIAGIHQQDKLRKRGREPENAPERDPVTLVTALLEPAVPYLELQGSVDAGIVVPYRGVRDM
jgi:hypothetical protein